MNKYQVILEGNNFLLKKEDKLVKHGFFTTRYVEANTPEEAELSAVALIKNDTSLIEAVHNKASSEPMIYLEELSELESFEGVDIPGSGNSFFVDKKPWWKFWITHNKRLWRQPQK